MSPQSPRGKSAARRTVLSLRDALTDAQRADASRAIAARVDAVLAEQHPGVLALYAAKGSEVATDAIDRAARTRGIRVVYPRVVRDTQCLSFHEVTLAELEPAGFALREPPAAAPEVPLAEIGAFVVPGLAFDRAGGARLGWGRGYYDATLAAAPAALRIGLAFEVQLVDGLAHDAHDVAMNLIVTEVATYVVA